MPTSRGPRPPALAASVRLWLAAAAAGLAGTVLALLGIDHLRGELLAEVAREFPSEAPAVQERVAIAALLVMVGSRMLLDVLLLGLAVAVRGGRRWARVCLLPLWLLGVAHAAFAAGRVPLPSLAALLLASGLATAAVVAMLLPSASSWLAGRTAPGGAPLRGGRR